MEAKPSLDMNPGPFREIWIVTEVRLWRRDEQYIAVITNKRDVEALSGLAGRRVILKLGDIYVDGTLLKVRHGNKFELMMVLPRRMALTWESLRSRSIVHPAIIIVPPSIESPRVT